nr:nuclease-related domain-containing protein [Wenzhouxiangella sp. XN79A]
MGLFFALLPGASSVDPGELAGVEGERAALDGLRALPDDFRVLNRVRLPDPRLPNGERELDFVVAGPTGLWVIEVKNTPGLVQVVPGARHWPLAKRSGCSSCPAWNAIDNPEHQLRDQLDAFGRWLLMNGVSLQPRGAICLAHPEVAIRDADEAAYPVCVPSQLRDCLQSGSEVRLAPDVPALLDTLSGPVPRPTDQARKGRLRSPSEPRR